MSHDQDPCLALLFVVESVSGSADEDRGIVDFPDGISGRIMIRYPPGKRYRKLLNMAIYSPFGRETSCFSMVFVLMFTRGEFLDHDS